MSRPLADYEYVSFDDFEEMLADKPQNERWELIGGRVVRLMVGARWEHARIVGNIARGMDNQFVASGSPCQTFTETFFMKEKALVSQLLPDVMVVCGDLEPGATSTAEPVVLVEVVSGGTATRSGTSTSNCRRSGTTCWSSRTVRTWRSTTGSTAPGPDFVFSTGWTRFCRCPRSTWLSRSRRSTAACSDATAPTPATRA